jgi:hypothetical protein
MDMKNEIIIIIMATIKEYFECYVIEKVNGIRLQNEDDLRYFFHYLSVETDIEADWANMCEITARSLLPPETRVVSSWINDESDESDNNPTPVPASSDEENDTKLSRG